ncbi:MAG TPA: hypothetical protein VK187_10135 [Geobacteraceae bacterium]|nr:hypothetical protein [Geobacteraceae bacterium]
MTIRWAIYILIGGAFWVTDALFLPFNVLIPTKLWIVAKTVLLPLVIIVTVRAMSRRASPKRLPASCPYLMLAGIWMAGPVYSLLLNRLYFKTAMGLGETLFHLTLFPLTTIVIATYSGALGGLIVASLFLVCAGMFTMGSE